MRKSRLFALALCAGAALLSLFLLLTFLNPHQVTAQEQGPGPGEGLSIFPNPPLAHEPTEIGATLINDTGGEITLFVQFFWSEFGIGAERHPIADRLPLVIPPNSKGSTMVVWIPPEMGPYCFYADIFETQGAPHPFKTFQHNMFYQAHPDPEAGLFTETFPFRLRNPLPEAAQIVLEVTTPFTQPSWIALPEPQQVTLGPGESITASLVLTYTGDSLPPEGGVQPFNVFATANDLPIGMFSKIFGPPLILHTRPEPHYAESEISVHPYPPQPGEPTEICVEVRNITFEPQEALVFFRVAPFGIGMPFHPIAPPQPVFIPGLGMRPVCVHWVSPGGGQFGIEVVVEALAYPFPISSQSILDVNEILLPGTTSTLIFPVRNPFNEPVTITMGVIPHMENWGISLYPDVLAGMRSEEVRPVTLTVEVPPDAPFLPDGTPIVDIEAYVGGEIIGGFRKVYRPPVPIHRPGEPIYAESEIKIIPYPPREREPTQVCVELRNPTETDQTMFMDIRWAEFGIGLPWHLLRTTDPFMVPAHGMVNYCIMWVPPIGGRLGIEVEVHIIGIEQSFFSQRMIDVGEILWPNEPAVFEFPVGNPFPFPIHVNLGAIRHLPQWEVMFEPQSFYMDNGQPPVWVRMTVIPVQRPGDPEPREGEPVIDVEAWWDNGQEQGSEHGLLGGFRKLFFPPIPVHRPEDPPFAEREIMISPYPPRAGEPTLIEFLARNPTTDTQVITVTFEIGSFGIGLPFHPIGSRGITLPPGGANIAAIVWVPPMPGPFCVRVKVEAPFFPEPFISSRNVDVIRLPIPYGEPDINRFVVGDNGIETRPLTISLGLQTFLPDWQVELWPTEIILENGQVTTTAVLTITPPADPEQLPRDGGPIADVAAFVDGELIGGIRKVWRPPVPLGHIGEPSYAESEISFSPDPPVAGQPVTIETEVRNNTDHPYTIMVEFGWADFGLGIPFTNTGVTPSVLTLTLGAHLTQTVGAIWIPQYSGNFCVQIILTDDQTNERQHSQRNVDVIAPPSDCNPIVKEFWVDNPYPVPITVEFGVSSYNLPPGWTYSIVPTQTVLAPNDGITVTMIITPPCDLLGFPVYPANWNAENGGDKIAGTITFNIEGYTNGELLGGVQFQLISPPSYRFHLPLVLRD